MRMAARFVLILMARALTGLAVGAAWAGQPPGEGVLELAEAPLRPFWQQLRAIWAFEITQVDGRPITVGSGVLALILLVVGYLVSRWLASALDRRVLSRLGVDRGAAAALRTLCFYVLLAIFMVWAFHLVGIPLAAFTVLGGVVAIGLGFGSQNVINNFISGLILLVERPIKVGDLVEVDGTFGTVERIGARSTHVRSGENTHMIIPNSSFLEKIVRNWTVSDDHIRASVDIGVAYGSPVEEVARLMLEAVADSPRALAEPAPEVLFVEFGDNALLFRVNFWIRIAAHMDRLRAQSEVRFAVERRFREAGIAIAFPQRDLHLDTLKPLEIRLIEGAAAAAKPVPGPS